jgi:hypothetical protein
MMNEIIDVVGQDECVARIEHHFRKCQHERDILYAREAIQEFEDSWEALRDAMFSPVEGRTPYQILIIEDAEEVSNEC